MGQPERAAAAVAGWQGRIDAALLFVAQQPPLALNKVRVAMAAGQGWLPARFTSYYAYVH